MTTKTKKTPILVAAELKLTSDERNALNRLLVILEEFRKVDQKMPLQQAITLITASLNPGSTVSDLAKLAGNTLASASRHVEALGRYREVKDVGKELLIDDYDAIDRRVKVVNLTSKGVAFIRALMVHLQR
jgi:DNA-binding MarR family transcriptional regulator